MTSHAGQVPLLRPAPIAVHDDGYVSRQAAQIELFKQQGLLGSQRSQRAGGGNLQRRVWFTVRHEVPGVSSLRRKVNIRFGSGAMPGCRFGHHRFEDHLASRQPAGGGAAWKSDVKTSTSVRIIMAMAV